MHVAFNRGKRSVFVDLTTPEGQAEIRALVVGNRVSHRERARIRGDDLVPVGVRGPSQVECAAAIVR